MEVSKVYKVGDCPSQYWLFLGEEEALSPAWNYRMPIVRTLKELMSFPAQRYSCSG